MENKRHPAYRLAFVGVMAALLFTWAKERG